MLDALHWLPFHHRLIFRIASLVWRCLLGLAPAYLRDLGTRGGSSLPSMERGLLFVPFARTSTSQAPPFSVFGPTVGNGLIGNSDCSCVMASQEQSLFPLV